MPNWVGDAVMALPAVRALKEAFPEAILSASAPNHIWSLFENGDLISSTFETPGGKGAREWLAEMEFRRKIKREAFDVVILFPNSFEAAARVWGVGIPLRIGYEGDVRSFMLTCTLSKTDALLREHMITYYLNLLSPLGVCAATKVPAVSLTEESERFAAEFIEKNRSKRESTLFALGVGTAYGTAKIWSAGYFTQVANTLIEKYDAEIVLTGSAAEMENAERLGKSMTRRPLISASSLINSAAILSRCRGFVGNDSGLLHIAAATGISTIGLYFATNPERNYPVGKNAHYIAKRIHCAYCGVRVCPLGTRECATAITPEDVMAKFDEIL